MRGGPHHGRLRGRRYAEYMVAHREGLVPVPDSLDAVTTAPLICAGLTAYNALRNSDASPGDLVAVQGIGGVGHMGLQFADRAGFETVAVSRGPDKREAAVRLGADHFVDAEARDPGAALRELGGVDVVLATAPSSDAIEAVVAGLAPNGQLVAVAPPHEPVELSLGPFVDNRWSLRGWSSGHACDAQDALEFSARRDIEPDVETYPLEDAPQAHHDMLAGDVRFRAVLKP